MSITKAEILTVLNNRLRRAETDIDEEIRSALSDLSSKDDFLIKEATRDTEEDVRYYSVPANFKDRLVIKVNDSPPLTKKTWGEYQKAIAHATGTGEPEIFALHNDFFWLHPCPGSTTYTMTLYYSIFHPDDLDDIEFPEIFREAVYEATICFYLIGKQLYEDLKVHIGLYDVHVATRKATIKKDPPIVKYRDF